MGFPAARITDMHVCPMVTPGVPPIPHVGGPILPAGAPTVLIGGLPAARVGDMAMCVGPPDSIVVGSATVITSSMPQARINDTTAHGGKIVMGCFTVIVGDAGGGGGGGGGGAGQQSSGDMTEFHGHATIAVGDTAKIVESLVAAAKHGTPFCEICFQQALARGASVEEAFEIAVADDD